MFILDRIDREVHSLKRLELKLGLSSEFSGFFHKIPVRILLDVLFRVFRFFKSLFYALTSSFMKLYRGIQRPFPPQCIDNTFWAIQSTFGCLEMHSKRRYKICICSVILGERESLRNCKGSSIISRKFWMQFDVLRKWEIFCFLSPLPFWVRNFRFPFLYEK